MTAPQFFARFAAPLPEAMLLLSADGALVAGNDAAAELLGLPRAALAGQALTDLVDEPPDKVSRVLGTWASSGAASLASIVWRRPDGTVVACRCDGRLLTPATESTPALVLLRCVPKESAGAMSRFLALNEKIDALAREIAERMRSEFQLREQRELLRVTLHSIGDAVVATDATGRVTFMNPVAEAVTGWDAAEAAGRHFEEVFRLVDDEARRPVDSPVARVLATGEAVELGNRALLVRRDGTAIPIADSAAPIRDEGRIRGAVLVFRDVSRDRTAELEKARLLREERAARAAAEESERRSLFLAEVSAVLASSLDYQTTLGSVARLAVPVLADWCMVDVVDAAGVIQRVGVSAADPAKEEVLGALQARYPARSDSPELAAVALRAGTPVMVADVSHASLAAVARDEDHLVLLRRLAPRSAIAVPMIARGRTVGAITLAMAESGRRYEETDVATAQDLARRAALAVDNAALYEEARQARVEAESASRAKDAFLAMVSHELRSPLATIAAWAQLLAAGRLDPEKRRHAIEAIARNARVQGKLIDDLLDVSRVVAGKLNVEKRPVDLVGVIELALEAARRDADAKGVALESSLDPSAAAVFGDPLRLQQVVANLVANGIKFTPRGGRVEVTLARQGTSARLEVRDTGEGLEPDALAHVFEPFWQENANQARRGLGLGLAIVRHLVDLHAGSVRAESAGKGRGATFVVELPILAVDVPAAVAETPTKPLDGLRILVVDDNADSRELVAVVLQQSGAVVSVAGSADEALAAFQAEAVDVIVSDIEMPMTDGYELIRRVRAVERAERRRPTAAVALSAHTGDRHRLQALFAGFQRYAAKPIDPLQLAQLVRSVVDLAA